MASSGIRVPHLSCLASRDACKRRRHRTLTARSRACVAGHSVWPQGSGWGLVPTRPNFLKICVQPPTFKSHSYWSMIHDPCLQRPIGSLGSQNPGSSWKRIWTSACNRPIQIPFLLIHGGECVMGREQRDSYLLVMGRGQSEEPGALSFVFDRCGR